MFEDCNQELGLQVCWVLVDRGRDHVFQFLEEIRVEVAWEVLVGFEDPDDGILV